LPLYRLAILDIDLLLLHFPSQSPPVLNSPTSLLALIISSLHLNTHTHTHTQLSHTHNSLTTGGNRQPGFTAPLFFTLFFHILSLLSPSLSPSSSLSLSLPSSPPPSLPLPPSLSLSLS